MKLAERILHRFGYTKKASRRSYLGAAIGRLTESWLFPQSSSDAEIKGDLKIMRGRCRDLSRNNDYARRYLKLVVANIVGPAGVQLQSKVKDAKGTMDNVANTLIEDAWTAWCRSCSLDGRLSWLDVQRIVAETCARDGEILVRLVRGRTAGNKFNFALQLLEADHLDESYNDGTIRMGIEYDDNGRPRIYHIYRNHPGDNQFSQRNDRIQVSADDMIHCYFKERPSQSRGVPWLHTSMTRMKNLGGYEEAEIVAARVAAAKMGFFTTPDGDGMGEKDDDGNFITEAEPGSFDVLPRGADFKAWDPTHPSGNYDAFVKATIRGISSGLGVSYSSLSSDLSDANYSSLRSGALVERDTWMTIQSWFIGSFVRPVFEAWLDMALLSGTISLPYSKLEKFNAPVFLPRRWQWVDPLKDIEAAILAIEKGLGSHSAVLAEQGVDFEENLDQLAWEQQLIKEKGVVIQAKQSPSKEIKNEQV